MREACRNWCQEELITTQQRKGAFRPSGERHAFRLNEVSPTKKTPLHILEFLITIEVGATRLAALRHTPEDLKKFASALVGMASTPWSTTNWATKRTMPSTAIVAATHNPHFKSLNEYLDHSVRRLIREARSNTAVIYNELIRAVQDEHRATVLFRRVDPVQAKLPSVICAMPPNA